MACVQADSAWHAGARSVDKTGGLPGPGIQAPVDCRCGSELLRASLGPSNLAATGRAYDALANPLANSRKCSSDERG